MIDIHTHIIPFVDDGCKSFEESLELIREEIEQGVTDIILTPHYRRDMFTSSLEKIKKNFDILLSKVKEEKLDIRIYLGQEIYISDSNNIYRFREKNLIMPINNTKYHLLEFSYTTYIDLTEVVYNYRLTDDLVIIAHIERYRYLKFPEVKEAFDLGALIQVNASSVVGKNGFRIKRKVIKYIKSGFVHFVASDIHATRKNYFNKAYKIIKRKFGIETAKKLFEENAYNYLINTK